MTRTYSPDGGQPPSDVYRRWQGCTDCKLGHVREERATLLGPEARDPPRIIQGEGAVGGLMLISSGPSWKDEKHGKFFAPGKWDRVSKVYERTGGSLVREMLAKLGYLSNVYFTGTTACRSCEQTFNEDGTPRMFFNEHLQKELPIYKDRHPLHQEFTACRTRLHEEIYAVDPLLILLMGPDVSFAVLHRRIVEYGSVVTLDIPGRMSVARRGKNGGWLRKFKGEVLAPVDATTITYPAMVLADPEEVLRTSADKRPDGLFRRFYRDLQTAIQVMERYRQEVGLTTEERYE